MEAGRQQQTKLSDKYDNDIQDRFGNKETTNSKIRKMLRKQL